MFPPSNNFRRLRVFQRKCCQTGHKIFFRKKENPPVPYRTAKERGRERRRGRKEEERRKERRGRKC